MPSFTSADPCDCCCPPDGKKCFQEWIAGWSCSTLTWTGPVTDNRLCLPMNTSTAWVKTSGDATGCQYRKYVPYDPKHCCSENGDCSGLGDTATPDLPFGGDPPDDCPCEPCVGDCGCRTVGTVAVVSFSGVLNAMPCTACGANVYRSTGSGTLGTYSLTGSPPSCAYEYVDLGFPAVVEEGAGPCPGTGYVPVGGGLDIVLSFDGVSTWTLTVRGTEVGAFFIADVDQGDCSGPLIFTNTIVAYDPCTGEDYMIDGTATVVFLPCVPA